MTRVPLTPEQRSLRARIANDLRWSRIPVAERSAHTQAARDALWRKYERQVDPDGKLDPAERARLARQARRADLARASLISARNRTRKPAE